MKRHQGCDKKSVRKEWIEDATIAFIRKIVFDDDLIEMLCETAIKMQDQENTTLPLLKKQYNETLKSIENLLNAIQMGILTPSTKQRMDDLEQQKTELSVQIIKEEMAKPVLSAEEIKAYFNRLRQLNFKRHDHRRRLIDTFINKIVLWDDRRIFFGCNYKDCSMEITFDELKELSLLGSDFNANAVPVKYPEILWFRGIFLTFLHISERPMLGFWVNYQKLGQPDFFWVRKIASAIRSADCVSACSIRWA